MEIKYDRLFKQISNIEKCTNCDLLISYIFKLDSDCRVKTNSWTK